MTLTQLRLATVILLGMGTPADSSAQTATSAQLAAVLELPRTNLNCLAPAGRAFDLDVAQRNGLVVTHRPSIGSALAVNAKGDLFGLTDRGPNTQLKPAGGGKKRRILPLPGFAPGIVRLGHTNGTLAILEFIPLRDRSGICLTGLANEATDEPCFPSANAAQPLTPDPGGVDPEGLRCLLDGTFLVSEEYSPSILVVSARGEVLVRYTPKSKPLHGVNYPVKPILPEALVERRVNRGFECLALSTDGRTAYAILQSPLGDEQKARYASSRLHRVIELDLSDPLAARVTGMFLLPATPFAEMRGCKEQNQVKLNDAEWLGPRRLLMLEQGKAGARLLTVDLNQATNLMGRPDAETLTFEDSRKELPPEVQTAATTTFLNLTTLPAVNSTKLEGIVILGPNEIALANDNDFGIGEDAPEESSRLWVLRLKESPFTGGKH